MIDERNKELREKFPLRQIRLDQCECGHDDVDHIAEIEKTYGIPSGVKDGACAICVCKGFNLPQQKFGDVSRK